MVLFESFKPKLKPGSTHIAENKVVFELSDGSRQISLPRDAADFLPFFDGTKTIQEIVQSLVHTGKTVHFKSLFEATHKLSDQGFLENAETFKGEIDRREDVFEKPAARIARPILILKLKKTWQSKLRSTPLFVAICSLLTLTSFNSLYSTGIPIGSRFVFIDGSYLYGLIFFFISCSVLISFKSLLKAGLSLLKYGRLSQLSIELNFFALALRHRDEVIYLTANKWLGGLFALTLAVSYFSFLALVSFLIGPGDLLDQLTVVATILTLVDLNPYRRSELTSFLHVLYNEDSIGHLLPYLQKRSLLAALNFEQKLKNEFLFALYSSAAIVWSFAAWSLNLNISLKNIPNLLGTLLKPGNGLEMLATGIIFLTISLMNFYLAWDIVKLLMSNVLSPFTSLYHRVCRMIHTDVLDDRNNEQIAGQLGQHPIFKGIRLETLHTIVKAGEVRRYQKDAALILQDSPAQEMIFILNGEVDVFVHEKTGMDRRVVSLGANALIGENSLIKQAKTSATVKATGIVDALVIQGDNFDKLLKHDIPEEDHAKIRERIMIGQYLASSSLFKGVPREIGNLIADYGELKDYRAGNTVFEQGSLGRDFYMILRGSVDVEINGKNIKNLKEGDFFGEIALIAHQARTASIKTKEDCQFLMMSSDKFWRLISENINLAMFIESVAEIRLKEDRRLGLSFCSSSTAGSRSTEAASRDSPIAARATAGI